MHTVPSLHTTITTQYICLNERERKTLLVFIEPPLLAAVVQKTAAIHMGAFAKVIVNVVVQIFVR